MVPYRDPRPWYERLRAAWCALRGHPYPKKAFRNRGDTAPDRWCSNCGTVVSKGNL